MSTEEELKLLRRENHDLKEKLQSYIPRRRVRRIFKSLKHILEQDIEQENIAYSNYLKVIVTKYRNEGIKDMIVDEPLITAIEHINGAYEETHKGG